MSKAPLFTVWKVVQTPVAREAETLINYYTHLITQRLNDIAKHTTILTAYGYFMKESFLTVVTGSGLKVITKTWMDADMRYLYNVPQRTGPGCRKRYSGKVNWTGIDKRVFMLYYQNDDLVGHEAVV